MLTGHPVPEKQKSVDLVSAFIAGAPRDAEGAVFYGVRDSNLAEWQRVRRAGEPFYYIDNSYFDRARGKQFRVTRNAMQHTGAGETNGKRLAALGYQAQPARQHDSDAFVLAIEQSPLFMRHIAVAPQWLDTVLRHYRKRPIKVRAWSPDKPEAMTTLHADLARTAVVVTHSSAAAVEAAMAGVQVLVSKASACHTLGVVLPAPAEVQRWAGVLADNQWSRAELRDGTAWRAMNG